MNMKSIKKTGYVSVLIYRSAIGHGESVRRQIRRENTERKREEEDGKEGVCSAIAVKPQT